MDRTAPAFCTTLCAVVAVAAPVAVLTGGLGESPWGSRYSYETSDVLVFQLLFATVTVAFGLTGVIAGVRTLRRRSARAPFVGVTMATCAMSVTWGVMAFLVFNGN